MWHHGRMDRLWELEWRGNLTLKVMRLLAFERLAGRSRRSICWSCRCVKRSGWSSSSCCRCLAKCPSKSKNPLTVGSSEALHVRSLVFSEKVPCLSCSILESVTKQTSAQKSPIYLSLFWQHSPYPSYWDSLSALPSTSSLL